MFFRSLAQDVGERAVAVVLSGSGSDGSRGIQDDQQRRRHSCSARARTRAQFNGMPLSAMRPASSTRCCRPRISRWPSRPCRPRRHVGRRRPRRRAPASTRILRLLRDEYAIDFSHYKASTVTRRIERRLALNRSLDIEMYVEQLRSDPRELNALYEDLLIGVTRFFRDDEAFESARASHHPGAASSAATATSRFASGCPGCATGQEAYSSRCCCTSAHRARTARKVKILATDVHKASLEVASAGSTARNSVAGISPETAAPFFTLKRERLSDFTDAAREHRVRAAQPHSRRAVHEDGPDRLPEPADLFPAARTEDGADAVPLLAEAGRRFFSWGRARVRAG